MKLISPISVTDAMISSDAPSDSYPAWAATGKQMSTDYAEIHVATVNNKAYVVKKPPVGPSGTTVNQVFRYHDLAAGTYTTPITTTSYIANPYYVEVSPNAGFVAFSGYSYSLGYYVVEVYETTTWTRVFYARCHLETSFYTSIMKFSPNSSYFAYVDRDTSYTTPGETHIRIMATATWTQQSISSYVGNTLISGYAGSPYDDDINDITFSDDSLFAYFTAHAKTASNVQYIAARVTVSTGATISTNTFTSSFYAAYSLCMFNNTRTELLVTTASYTFLALNETTLATSATVPSAVTGFIDHMAHSPSTDEMIICYLASPYYKRIKLSDYTNTVSPTMPTHIDSGNENNIYYTTDYYLWQDVTGGGFGLTARSDDTEVTVTNPTVAIGERWILNNTIYEAVSANSDRPDIGAALTTPSWIEVSTINRLRMFDNKLDSVTTSTSVLTVDITPAATVTGIAILNTTAYVQITMDDPIGGVVYSSATLDMSSTTDLVLTDLPNYPNAVITVTFTTVSGTVSCGELVLGAVSTIGECQLGVTVGILDFSRKERDSFGNYYILERKYSKRATYPIVMLTSNVSTVYRLLTTLRATPAVYIGDEDHESTIIYGYYKDFSIVLAGLGYSEASLVVEGL